jgi:hypothetical protein
VAAAPHSETLELRTVLCGLPTREVRVWAAPRNTSTDQGAYADKKLIKVLWLSVHMLDIFEIH